MPSRKSDVRRSDVSATTISNHHAPAADSSEDSLMTSVPPLQSESSATPTAAAATTAVTFAPPLPTEHAAPESPGVVVGRAESNAGTSEKGKERERDREGAVTIEDLNLPKSIITRLAKGVLPPNTQIQANAILALSKSATVFISHLSNAANEWTQSGGKKTIMPADVFRALDDIEYGFMRERLEAEFASESIYPAFPPLPSLPYPPYSFHPLRHLLPLSPLPHFKIRS
ncbi:histone-fold-containing protein [Coniochaeta sp. 2T2.1]|nr:histone-fold-containing protein [Coniochaeta sp. 2T2.1]